MGKNRGLGFGLGFSSGAVGFGIALTVECMAYVCPRDSRLQRTLSTVYTLFAVLLFGSN